MTTRGVYKDGFQPLTDYKETIYLPVGSSVAISPGDVVTLSSGYVALATTLQTEQGVYYVAVSENTAAQASTDGAVDVACISVRDNVRYMVPVTANAVLAQATHVGNIYNLDGSEDGITVAAAVTEEWGFLIEEIDITTEAVAVNTYGYAIGRFVGIVYTTG